jgi:hypothetical protein
MKKIDLMIFKSPGFSTIEYDVNVKSSKDYKIKKIEKILNNIGFHSLVFTNHMHHEWMFVKATK